MNFVKNTMEMKLIFRNIHNKDLKTRSVFLMKLTEQVKRIRWDKNCMIFFLNSCNKGNYCNGHLE